MKNITQDKLVDFLWKNLVVIVIHSIADIVARKYIGLGEFEVTPVFPPAGIAFSLALIWGYKILPGLWIASTASHFFLTGHLVVSMVTALGNIIQTFFAVWVLQTFTHTKTPFYSPYKVAVFIFGSGFASCLINSTIGTLIHYYYHIVAPGNFFITWLNWWLADSMGVITFGTVIMVWYHAKVVLSWQKILELTVLAILFIAFVIFEYYMHWPLARLLLPFVIWSGVRFGPQITALVCLVVSFLVFDWATHWYYVYPGVSTTEALLFAQSFVATTFFMSLMLVAVLAERERTKDKLVIAHEELETRVSKRTTALAEKNNTLKITMRGIKEAQAQLVHAEKMSALGVLTAGIAHEINNSVNFISANIPPLKNDIDDLTQALNKYAELKTAASPADKLNELEKYKNEINLDFILQETDTLLNGIQEGTQRTTAIVKDLRTFSRLDEGELKSIAIQENIDSTLNLLKSSYIDRIAIVKNYNNVPEIECYPGKINQVFMNLLTNAIQAIPDKGEIIITTSSDNHQVCVSIKDSGVGMSKEIQDQIFEPFFTTKEVGKGTGLGLSISYGIIQEHHGTITVKSEPGKGSEFIVCLPVVQK